MAETTSIEWTDATWNPITGCTLVSEGCRHCYAATLAATRLKNHPSRAGLARVNAAGEAKFTGEVRLNEDWLDQPLRWRRPRRIFVCAHGDLFHEAAPTAWIDRVFATMALAPQHTFQVLTKRPERARTYLSGEAPKRLVRIYADRLRGLGRGEIRRTTSFDIAADRVGLVEDLDHADIVPRLEDRNLKAGWPLPNVWLGTSVEDQAAADARIPHLLGAPAAVRFLSAEPLLGPVDLTTIPSGEDWLDALTGERLAKISGCVVSEGEAIDWAIVGGESGPGARPMHPDWARSLRDQCAAAGVPFFFKQWGSWVPISEIAAPDDLYQPLSEGDDPEASRRLRLASLVMHADGAIFDRSPAGAYHQSTAGAFAAGAKAMLMFEIAKKSTGRLLDGREHNGMPGEGRA